jgi:hypothetical protein
MFIVTASIVKPVNRDDLPTMRGIDGLKGSSPLGVEPRGEGIQGQSGFKISGQSETAPKPVEPAKPADPKAKAAESTSESTGSSAVTNGASAPQTPVARASSPEPNKP